MRQEVIISSLSRRVRQSTNLVLVVLVGGIFCIFRLAVDLPPPGFLELVLPLILLLAHLALSPIPWQWTGDDAFRANLGRGFLQAVCFNALWLGGLLLLLNIVQGPPRELAGALRPPPLDPMGLPLRREFHALDPGLGLALVNFAFAIVFGWVFAEKEATEARERQTADLLRESRAKALQNQLEPHVLYNALSSLSELVYEDPLAAEDVITRLAELYRMLTVHGRADRVSLGQERRLVEAYLAMEQMRLGERLTVTWDWPAALDDLQVPPLFLQPLVENAIKHGISPSDQGGEVVISGGQKGRTNVLTVRNSGRPLVEGNPRGVGLGSIEARLQLWTGVTADFSLTAGAGWTTARIHWTQGERT
jgi:two-component sensor histidine kinase